MLELFEELENYEQGETTVCENITDYVKYIGGKQFFNICHFNIRSINKNYDEFLLYIETFDIKNIDIIVLSESWQVDNVKNYGIPGFEIFYNESLHNQNDGVVVYVKKYIECSVSIKHFSETKLLELSYSLNNISFILTASYRPPSTNLDN